MTRGAPPRLAPGTIAAYREAEAARLRMMDTIATIRARVAPSRLAHDAWEQARERSTDAAEQAARKLRARPALAATALGAIAALIAARPLWRALRRRQFRHQETEAAAGKFTSRSDPRKDHRR